VHCLLGQEGTPPSDLLTRARFELERYTTVKSHADRVTEIAPSGSQFSVACADGFTLRARKVLLTTGLTDEVPRLEGIERLYGRSVHHCPYCDGFEHRDQPLAVYGAGDRGAGLALIMKQWSSDVLRCTDGPSQFSSSMQARLQQHGIQVCSETIAKLEGTDDGMLQKIHLQSGNALKRAAIFFTTGCHQSSDLSAALGCARDKKSGIVTDPVSEESSVRDVYVAGDASRDVLLVAVAIAEGAKAGVAINRALLQEDGLGYSHEPDVELPKATKWSPETPTNPRSEVREFPGHCFSAAITCTRRSGSMALRQLQYEAVPSEAGSFRSRGRHSSAPCCSP
jgi:thioredoxin reductase